MNVESLRLRLAALAEALKQGDLFRGEPGLRQARLARVLGILRHAADLTCALGIFPITNH